MGKRHDPVWVVLYQHNTGPPAQYWMQDHVTNSSTISRDHATWGIHLGDENGNVQPNLRPQGVDGGDAVAWLVEQVVPAV